MQRTGPGQQFLERLGSCSRPTSTSSVRSPAASALFPFPPSNERRSAAEPTAAIGQPHQSPPESQPCRGPRRRAAGSRAPGGRCGTSSPPGWPRSARRSSRCSAARSPPRPPAPGMTRSPPPPPPSRPTSRRTGPRSTPRPARTRRGSSPRGTGGPRSSSPSCGSATSTRPSSPRSSARYRPRRGSSRPQTASTAGSAPPSLSSPIASAGPRRPSWQPRSPEPPTWRRSWRSSRASRSMLTASVGAFFRSSSPPPGGTRRRSTSRLCRASCYQCTTPRSSAALISAAPRPVASPPSCSQGIFGKHEMG